MRRQYPDQQAAWLQDVYQGLSQEEKKKLRHSAETRWLEGGDRVTGFQDSIIRIDDGLLRVAVTSEDRSLTVSLHGPNDTIVLPMYHSWDENLYIVEAQEISEIRVIPRDVVLELAATNQQFAHNLMRQLSWNTYQLMGVIHMLSFYNLPQRVAQVLLNLATMFGRPDEKGGLKLGLRFTQEELAELAGARRETLSTVLQEFREDDILNLRYARIDIKNIDALEELAGVKPLPFFRPKEESSSQG